MKAFLSFVLLCILTIASTPTYADAIVGKPAPDFALVDAHGKTRTLKEFQGKIVVLEWFNPECPFVKKHYGPGSMQASQKAATDLGAIWLTINSSAEGKQGYYSTEDAPKAQAELKMNSSALLLDPEGVVGKAYGAKTTPHMFVVGADGTVAYAGAIDSVASADPEDIKGATNYVLAAVSALKSGKQVVPNVTSSYGCSVKYKAP